MSGHPASPPDDAMPTGTTQGAPQVLLAHHLKQLKLPTVRAESTTRWRVRPPETASITRVTC